MSELVIRIGLGAESKGITSGAVARLIGCVLGQQLRGGGAVHYTSIAGGGYSAQVGVMAVVSVYAPIC